MRNDVTNGSVMRHAAAKALENQKTASPSVYWLIYVVTVYNNVKVGYSLSLQNLSKFV